jgi:hypothetical protein
VVQQGVCEVIEGALAAVAPVAFAPGPVVVSLPRINIVALAAGTLESPIFPPQHEVARQLRALARARATDFLAAIFPVGADAAGSRARTWALLQSLHETALTF